MPLSPEDSQYLTNLQKKILTNAAENKPTHDGITREDLKKALDLLRGDRAKALAAGAAKPAAKKRGAKPAAPSTGKSLDELLAGKGVNLD